MSSRTRYGPNPQNHLLDLPLDLGGKAAGLLLLLRDFLLHSFDTLHDPLLNLQ